MKKKAWFYDIANNLTVAYREYEPGMLNSGDYAHHNWVGPYKTQLGARREGLKLLKSELNMATRRYEEFKLRTAST